MELSARIVDILLETGEPDQNYDHAIFDAIVNELAKAGFPGATHREFDKYQGVYIRVPNIDKFWYGGSPGFLGQTLLYPEMAEENGFVDADDPEDPWHAAVFVTEEECDISQLVAYCRKVYQKSISKQAVDNVMANDPEQSIEPKSKASMLPLSPSIGRSGLGQPLSRLPSR